MDMVCLKTLGLYTTQPMLEGHSVQRIPRTERPRETKIGTGIAHVTSDSDTTFKVKRSKVKVTRPL